MGYYTTLHDGPALVVLDIVHPLPPLERNLFSEALLPEVADGIVVGIGEEVHDFVIGAGLDVVFDVVHEMRAIALDLLVRR